MCENYGSFGPDSLMISDEDCYMVYNAQTWEWDYPDTTSCNHVMLIVNTWKHLALAALMTALDMTTLFLLRRHDKV